MSSITILEPVKSSSPLFGALRSGMRDGCEVHAFVGESGEEQERSDVKSEVGIFLWGTLIVSLLAVLRALMGSLLLGDSKSDIND